MTRALALTILVFGLFAPPARAQLGGLPLPDLPSVGGVVDTLPDVEETADAPLRDVRRLRVRDLLRRNRTVLEADPQGQLVVRGQILALGASPEALARARAAGFEIVRSDDVGELGALVVLRAPRGLSTRRALRQLQEADPAGLYDFDHLHLETGASARAFATVGGVRGGARVGLIDSGVAAHASLAGAIAAQRAFVGDTPVPGAHGTAVASLVASAAPGVGIYAADIYGGAPTGGASSALARAFAWLVDERIPVINVSLVGPRNRIVEALVGQVVRRGVIVVAAVGNDGPAAPPLYPAAYDGVVGVTGVDARSQVLNEAGRGAHVDFAALGMSSAAAPNGRSVRVRGTSFAAPVVSGLLAARLSGPDPQGAQRAIASLSAQARDLGARGRDEVYGYGLVSISASRVAAD
jgi:subtilisin family serine protease